MALTRARLIEALQITEAQADQVLGLIRGTVDPFSVPAVDEWRRQCYHEPDPKRADTIMRAVDAVLGTYGTEAIRGQYVDRYNQDIVAEYCNTGDSYAATILYDAVARKYRLTSWGDFVEKFERRYAIQ